MSDASDPGTAAHDDSSKKKLSVELDVPAEAVKDLIDKKASNASQEEKDKASTSKATHDISLKVTDTSWAEFQSKLGKTDFLDSGELSLTPASGTDPLHADLHLDLVKQQWTTIGGITATTDLTGGLKVTDGKGIGGDFKVEQDIKYKSISLTGSITTDLGSGSKPSVSGEVGLKFEF
jgi:hypothetical protein